MRIVAAPDSFKECLSATDAARAIAAGLQRAAPNAEVDLAPMADGGEGTVEALVTATGGHFIEREVTGPQGTPVRARYGILGDDVTAVIEMAAAAGLHLVPPDQRDPRQATTYGVGELIRDAMNHGARSIILGLGGSSTTDAGAGMAQALGYSLRNADGLELPPGGAALTQLESINAAGRDTRLANCKIHVACDVDNPLYGPKGAAYVYGPQKGASAEVAQELDTALRRFANVVRAQLGADVANLPGGGAAGGLGAGLVAFAHGKLQRGFDLIADACGLENRIAKAQLIITGEGRLDHQTAHGKTPAGVARLAQRHGVPAIALAGALGPGYTQLYLEGLTAAFAIADGPLSLDESKKRAAELLADRAEAALRCWMGGKVIKT